MGRGKHTKCCCGAPQSDCLSCGGLPVWDCWEIVIAGSQSASCIPNGTYQMLRDTPGTGGICRWKVNDLSGLTDISRIGFSITLTGLTASIIVLNGAGSNKLVWSGSHSSGTSCNVAWTVNKVLDACDGLSQSSLSVVPCG